MKKKKHKSYRVQNHSQSSSLHTDSQGKQRAQGCTGPPPRQGLSSLFFLSLRLRLRANFGTGMHHAVDCADFPFTDLERPPQFGLLLLLLLPSIITTPMWPLLVAVPIVLPCSLSKLSRNSSISSFFVPSGDGSTAGVSTAFGRHIGVLLHDGVLSARKQQAKIRIVEA